MQRGHELDDLLAVTTGEEAELVLDDDGIEALENADGAVERGARAAYPLANDARRRCGLAGLVDAAHDPCTPRRPYCTRERGGEGGEPAPRRRERADEPDRRAPLRRRLRP